VLIDAIYIFFNVFFSVYTQYLWPISPISPMHCFYRPFFSMERYGRRDGGVSRWPASASTRTLRQDKHSMFNAGTDK